MTDRWIGSVDELPAARTILLDVTPRQVLRLAGHKVPARFAERLRRYRYGMGAFKLDWALDGPIPWAAPEACRAGTLHLGWPLDEIATAERASWAGQTAARPFVLVAQPTVFDRARAPDGGHTAWAYCHVPHNSAEDLTMRIEQQIERFAPGFGARIVARSVRPPARLEAENPNLVGGDINGGLQDVWQAFLRPTRLTYRTPAPELFLCSAATPPGGGVHGMSGFWAARQALKRLGLEP